MFYRIFHILSYWSVLYEYTVLITAVLYISEKYTAQDFYPFGPGIFFKIWAHPVLKMWILQEPKKIALWNKRHLEEKNTENVQHV